MTWIRLDDGFISHPKTLSLPHLSIVLHIAGLTYCCTQLTDGEIPKIAVPLVLTQARVKRSAITPLVDVGMWDEQAECYVIHDFLEYQESRERVLERREKWARKKRAQRPMSPGDSDGESTGGPCSMSPPSRPDPTPLSLVQVDIEAAPPSRFDEFWSLYPRRESKKRAQSSWSRLPAKDKDAALLALPGHVRIWATRDRKFVPHPDTWLNGRRWEDEMQLEHRGQVVNGERRAPGASW